MLKRVARANQQYIGKRWVDRDPLVPQFSTWRMVQEYTRKFYQAK
ncbi:MAG: hypothetical protein ACKODH_16100 [Limisphaerales bacterium]